MSSGAMQPADPNGDLMIAWKKYQKTEDFKNTKHWALVITPFTQVGSEAHARRDYEIMSFEQRERHIMGSLWACFMEGFKAGGKSIVRGEPDEKEQPRTPAHGAKG